jgi:pentose-5-phosphate-3-epimerase
MKKLIVAPSVLSADFLNLERDLAQMEAHRWRLIPELMLLF